MKSDTLYLIGNGFDLWHGIPSSLAKFKQYVRLVDPDIYREVEEYLPTREDWSDLELALADIDVNVIIDNLGHFMSSYGADDWSDSGHHDFQYEVQNVVNRLSIELRKRFTEWVRKLPIPSPETTRKRLANLDAGAVFFSFNYTSTLEKLYGVDSARILFIHGRADLENDQLVLGHGWEPQNRKSLNDYPGIEEIDSRLFEANDILDDYFSATYKPSKELITENRAFFNNLTNTKQVIVLGHSLSPVDSAYFSALLEQHSIAKAQWQVACRSPEEWVVKRTQLTSLGIDPAKAIPIFWDKL